jgi:hypothetical protein
MSAVKGRLALWNKFCQAHSAIENSAPLFELSGENVSIYSYGKNKRPLLQRSKAMDNLVIAETDKVLKDFETGTDIYDGLIYMMFWVEAGSVIPLYIGKSEKIGRRGGNLSANIKNIQKNIGKFSRWGYNYAYHLGDLSAVVCPGHPAKKSTQKYREWAERLFVSWPSPTLRLHRETHFWMKAWSQDGVSIWKEYGRTSLTFLEYLLIGVASDLFPETLLNREGVNRR